MPNVKTLICKFNMGLHKWFGHAGPNILDKYSKFFKKNNTNVNTNILIVYLGMVLLKHAAFCGGSVKRQLSPSWQKVCECLFRGVIKHTCISNAPFYFTISFTISFRLLVYGWFWATVMNVTPYTTSSGILVPVFTAVFI